MKALLLISGTFAIFILVFFVLLYYTQRNSVIVQYSGFAGSGCPHSSISRLMNFQSNAALCATIRSASFSRLITVSTDSLQKG